MWVKDVIVNSLVVKMMHKKALRVKCISNRMARISTSFIMKETLATSNTDSFYMGSTEDHDKAINV